jgi:hypothetical protein
VSKGFLSDPILREKLDNTKQLKSIDPGGYDAVHVAGGRGATFDLYPNEDVARTLEHFRSSGKSCWRDLPRCDRTGQQSGQGPSQTGHGFSLEEDRELERLFGRGFIIPHNPQTSLEEVGVVYSRAGLHAPHVMVDGKLITGQNQQSASEYGMALFHILAGQTAFG